MTFLAPEGLWEIAKSLLAGAVVAGTMLWRSYRHFDARFDDLDKGLRREAGRVDALEIRLGALATSEDLSGIRREINEVELQVAGVVEAVKGLAVRLDTVVRQNEMLIEHAMKKESGK